MKFGELIEYHLSFQKMTKKELALRANVTVRSLNYYLSGNREPYISTADRILSALGITMTIGSEGGTHNESQPKEGPPGSGHDTAADG